MANQKRQLNGAQTARKGPQSRRGQPASQPTAAPAGKGTANRAAGGTRNTGGASAARTGTRTPAGATANDKPAGGKAVGGGGPTTRNSGIAAPASTAWTPLWVRVAPLALSLIGLGLGIYLTIAHLAGAGVLLCSNKGLVNCEAVTTSPESELFGIFPVAELGLAFYVFMTAINLPWLWRPEWRWMPARGPLAGAQLRRTLPLAAWRVRLGASIVGVLFVLYLIYTELITLRTICLWCTYVHITTFVLFVILVAQATFWGSPAKATAGSTTGRAVR